jgi:Fe-Mn family superoxide dismutase
MYSLPDLDYGYDAFGKYISKAIMELHHSKHHQTYVDKLNAALEQAPELQQKSLEDLLRSIDSLPNQVKTAVRNHGGGHYNHTQFWQWMSPEGGGEPSGALADALKEKYGNFPGAHSYHFRQRGGFPRQHGGQSGFTENCQQLTRQFFGAAMDH